MRKLCLHWWLTLMAGGNTDVMAAKVGDREKRGSEWEKGKGERESERERERERVISNKVEEVEERRTGRWLVLSSVGWGWLVTGWHGMQLWRGNLRGPQACGIHAVNSGWCVGSWHRQRCHRCLLYTSLQQHSYKNGPKFNQGRLERRVRWLQAMVCECVCLCRFEKVCVCMLRSVPVQALERGCVCACVCKRCYDG